MGYLGGGLGHAIGGSLGSIFGLGDQGADIGRKIFGWLPFKGGGLVHKEKEKRKKKGNILGGITNMYHGGLITDRIPASQIILDEALKKPKLYYQKN